ncbi:PREDICTED: mucin-4-like [Chrysochloris asiatica]|uniref:Mucin-4-like n=1 Tax=Chrysochloris asiatica TaxID=185453 RepID=A0A9B0TXB0_CHRAS|nr:PREDICTED: mucin-4-like [Chrysochloris asiatica]
MTVTQLLPPAAAHSSAGQEPCGREESPGVQHSSLPSIRRSQTSSITRMTTPPSSPSPSVHNPTDSVSQETSSSGGTTDSSLSSFSHTALATSELLTASTSNTGKTSQTVNGSFPSVTSTVSMTTGLEGQSTPSTATPTQETSALSQTLWTQSTETTGRSQAGIITRVTTPPVPPSPSEHIPTETVSQKTTTSSETTTSGPTSGSHTSPMASSIDMTLGNTREASLSITTSFPPVTSKVSTAWWSGVQSTPISFSSSNQKTSAVSQTHQSEGTEFTRGTLAKSSSSASMSQEIFTARETTTFPSLSSRDTHTTQSQTKLPPMLTGNTTTVIDIETSSTATTAAILRVSQIGHTHGSHSTQESQTMNSISPMTDNLKKVTIPTSFFKSSGPSPSVPILQDTSEARIMTTSSRTNSGRSTATTLPKTAFQTLTTSITSTSIVIHSSPPVPIKPDKGVSLFPYGLSVQDQKFVKRTVDFTSLLFKPKIGFPFGSSLRDSLYFTDNGQIIFPESDNQVFSYPNPPSRGFTGWESVALVAPFWDDADFSSHRGTIFYQEYKTFYDEYNPLVRQVESWIEKFANTWYYKARWTLKVTWVNVPAYPAHWTSGTNTYQAILSTDGSKSYALFLYQSGGMQWDAAQRPGNSVLIGFSSGDGYFQNSPLTSRPVWEKYRPDQFLNFNSGLRGLQIYTLHREERPNYRLKCLQWLKRQPQWPSWGWHQISCPCSWQQGRWDLRFQPTNIGWWGSSRQLCSFSSWRGGVCCSYGPWGEFLEGWRVPSPWQFDQELESKSWCCHWNDKPFFCTLYKQRQPRVSCAGYRPPRPAWMFGDPHITTFDGANYTFSGLGDFLLIRAKNRNSSFLLQGRTAQTGMAKATNFIAFAAQYHSIRLEPITVQWLLESNDKIHVQLNNKTVTFETNNKDADGQEIFNTTGIILIHNGSMVSANFDGTVTISVIAASNILHASSSLPEEYQNHTEGLLGVWNDNPNDDFKMSNGTTLPLESSEEMIFHYGMTWEINGTSLLGNRNDQLPSNFTPIFFKQLSNTSLDQNLISHCNEDTQCIFDTLATRNMTTGQHTKMLFRRFQEINATLNQYPPSIEGEPMLTAYKGQTKLFQYSSKSENTTFSLRNNSTDFTLLENGTLLWTPNSLEPFTLEILAKNVKNGLSSELQPTTVACFCSAESQCLYNMTSRVGNSSLEVANCKCDGDIFGHRCERSRDPCEECFPNVNCTPGKGCEACPPHLTGDGRHCAALENSFLCENKSCPVNYCYNHGHCYISPTPDCQPTCTCPPAFTDTRCFLAGNNFTPSVSSELPLRIIQLLLSEEENASVAEVNASVAYRLGTLDVRAFFRNSQVEARKSSAPASGSSLHRWTVISEFQYRPGGPVIDFLNNQLLDAVVEAFLPQAPRKGWSRSEGPRHNVSFHPISRRDIHNLKHANVSTLETHFQCNGYKGYHLVYSPQRGFTCVSPCSEGYCKHGGQCQHLPEGPHCSCVPFSIYTPWGEHCEHLSLKLGAFFGILFGALGALLLLGVVAFVALRFCSYSKTWDSYPLGSES